jgi:hypothetical protein
MFYRRPTMTVFPARRPLIAASEKQLVPVRDPRSETYLAPRPGPTEWARRRRAQRETRRIEAAGGRAISRIEQLGSAWHVVDWPRTELAAAGPEIIGPRRKEQAGFLAIGPSGIFAVSIADHGRTRVLVAGDVVQINGRRPPYIAEARDEAKQAAKALSQAVGHNVPVVPVLTFVGSGVISVYGLPKDCLVASYQDLDRLLIAGGARISARTAEKLTAVARHPSTWHNGTYQAQADRYRWYGPADSAAAKVPSAAAKTAS